MDDPQTWNPEDQEPYDGCECELDWRCHLHEGMFTPLELINDAWASEQSDLDAAGGWAQ